MEVLTRQGLECYTSCVKNYIDEKIEQKMPMVKFVLARPRDIPAIYERGGVPGDIYVNRDTGELYIVENGGALVRVDAVDATRTDLKNDFENLREGYGKIESKTYDDGCYLLRDELRRIYYGND